MQASFDDYADNKIAIIQKKINNRLRQKLNFETPPKRVLQKNIVIDSTGLYEISDEPKKLAIKNDILKIYCYFCHTS